MTEHKNPYELKEKYWIISEVKASMIEVYNNFLNKQDVYVKSLKKLVDPFEAKGEYVAALYGFYTLMLNGFIPYLANTDENKRYGLTEDDYRSLALENQFEDNKLVDMGYLLQRWASTLGPFRITHQEKEWIDQVEQLKYENQQ